MALRIGCTVAFWGCLAATACRKEAATTTPDTAPVEDTASAGPQASGDAASAARYLPAGASLSLRLDARALFGDDSAAVTQTMMDALTRPLGEACRAALPRLRELVLGRYDGPPGGVVLAVVSEPDTDVAGCLAGLPSREPTATRTEDRAGREVTLLGEPPRLATFPVSETVTLVAAPELLEAALAAAEAAATPAEPDANGGWLTGSYRPAVEDGAMVARAVSVLLRSDPLPPPSAVALRMDGTDRPTVRLSIALADEPAATTFTAAMEPALARVRAAWTDLRGALPTGSPDEARLLDGVGGLFESLALRRNGTTVQLEATTDLSPLELVGVATSFLVPMIMKFVESTASGEAQLNLSKIASLAEFSVTDVTGQGPAFPSNERVAGPCTAPDCNAECVPRSFAAVRGTTYVTTTTDWNCSTSGPGCTPDTAWAGMHFEIAQPIRYQYCWSASGAGDEARFRVSAFGDLDGDGVPSVFYREGRIIDGQPVIGPIAAENRDE